MSGAHSGWLDRRNRRGQFDFSLHVPSRAREGRTDVRRLFSGACRAADTPHWPGRRRRWPPLALAQAHTVAAATASESSPAASGCATLPLRMPRAGQGASAGRGRQPPQGACRLFPGRRPGPGLPARHGLKTNPPCKRDHHGDLSGSAVARQGHVQRGHGLTMISDRRVEWRLIEG